MSDEVMASEIALVEIVDRLLERGVVLAGAAVISIAGVELIELRLSLALASVDAFKQLEAKAS